MKLLSYIALNKAAIFKSTSPAMNDRVRQFCDSLAAFPDAADADLRVIQSSRFIFDYGDFLHNTYEKKYSPAICKECLKRLRTVLRYSIVNYQLPNFDPFPDVRTRLNSEVWHTDEKETEAKMIETHLSADVQRLSRHIAWSFSKHNTALRPANPQQARKLRDEMSEVRAAMVYLFGLLFYGHDIRSVLSLPEALDGHVYSEKFGRRLPLSQAAKELVRMYNHGKICTGNKYLFKALADSDTDEQIATKARNIERKTAAYLRRFGLSLFRQPAFDECITIAVENGADSATIEKAIAAAENLPAIDADALAAINPGCNLDQAELTQRWYALCSYSPRLRGVHMRKFVADSGVLGRMAETNRRLYDPFDKNAKDEPGVGHSIDRFLFFRSTPAEALLVDRVHADAAVMRRRDNKEFVTIPQVEIEFMQEQLRDFRDDVELINRDAWMKAHESEFVRQAKVIIHEGPFKGYSATIVDIKKKGEDKTFYILELAHDHYTIKATRQALSIDHP